MFNTFRAILLARRELHPFKQFYKKKAAGVNQAVFSAQTGKIMIWRVSDQVQRRDASLCEFDRTRRARDVRTSQSRDWTFRPHQDEFWTHLVGLLNRRASVARVESCLP
jgi:hypothetical protein